MDTSKPDNNPVSSRKQSNLSRFQNETSQSASLIESNRAQTSIDLLLAVMVFFGAVAIVTIQSPGLFFPSGLSATDTVSSADRIALELTNSELTTDGSQGLSNEEVTEFFSNSTNGTDAFSVDEDQEIRIRISTVESSYGPPTALDPDRNPAVQTGDNEYYLIEETSRATGSPADQNTVTVYESVDDRRVKIEVSVWSP